MSQEEEEQPRVLAASVADFRYFAALLKGVSFTNRARVSIDPAAFIVTVEEARSIQATAYIFRDIFDEYVYRPESRHGSQDLDRSGEDYVTTVFEIPLHTLIECLNIFGSTPLNPGSATKKKQKHEDGGDSDGGGPRNRDKGPGDPGAGIARLDQWFAPGKGTGMRLSYAGAGHPLTLFIVDESGGPTATCEITTWEHEPTDSEFSIDGDGAVLKIILKSSWLRDALAELDQNTTTLTIIGNPPPPGNRIVRNAPPRLRLRAVGQFGTTEMDYPNDREVLETCECPEAVSFTYRYSHVAKALRAMQSSMKTSLRIDQTGMLSLQFMMPTPRRRNKQAQAFIEFWCLAMDDP
ncbi:Rad1-domain-containing protein [Epithele typhae]|uniref:Rad1-domain-containing protein n=1 Tax=Epithele typhae TaxID=378194 RepID=UPI002008BB8A|nr:Rad1-domain-containing protein [Epithele typhae]KAH9915785.1 Rad1-domain-containing protein [Epithele typhae]